MKIKGSTICDLCDIFKDIATAAYEDRIAKLTEEQTAAIINYAKDTAIKFLSAWEDVMGEEWQVIDDIGVEELEEPENPDYYEEAVAAIERLRAALAPTPEDNLVINKLKASLHGEKPSAPPVIHNCLLKAFATSFEDFGK